MIEITLSRRNLLSLLHKLEMPGSARTIVKYSEDGEEVYVIAETDEIVYADRPPGNMHPETEQFVQDMYAALEIVRTVKREKDI